MADVIARSVFAALMACTAFALAGCGGDEGGPATTAAAALRPSEAPHVAPQVDARRGTLLHAREVGTSSPAELRATLHDEGFPTEGVRYGAIAYELSYVTIDARGRETVATGLVAFPQGADGALPIVVYHHGTVFTPAAAPSRLTTFEGAGVAALFASAGFAYAAPDYLGLGGGRGPHPYLHARSEATASLDLLRAMRTFAARRGVELRRDVYVTGFSQGGQATMALGELLAAEPERDLRVRALAPIAGPLDLSGATWRSLSTQAEHGPDDERKAQYLAKALLAWDRLYDLFDAPSDVFSEEYAGTIDAVVDRGEPGASPPSVDALLRDDALQELREPNSLLAEVLRANDSCTTAPQGRVRLYQGDADQLVVPQNAERCRELLEEQGVAAEVVDLGDVGHGASAFAGLPLVERWFSQLSGLTAAE